MQLQSLSRRYTVRQLMETDVDAMLALCSGNPQFYRYHPPMATKASILDDLQAVPPGKTLSDKYFIGFYDGETLAAMMDLITGYPNPATAYIGLFMVDAAQQGRGTGSAPRTKMALTCPWSVNYKAILHNSRLTAQAPLRRLRHVICVAKMLDNVGLRYPHRALGAKAPRTLRPLPLLRFAVSATGGAHLSSIQYYLRFWLSICRTSLAVSALRIMWYCRKNQRKINLDFLTGL